MKETAPEPGDYLVQVERFFLRRRGWGLILSPKDWQRIGEWQAQGIPLRVALQGIDRALRQLSCTKKQVRSLAFCEGEVQAVWQEYLKAGGGKVGFTPAGRDMQSRLAGWLDNLSAVRQAAQCDGREWLEAAISEVILALDKLASDYQDWPVFELEFNRLYGRLMGQLKENTPPDEMAQIYRQARECLKRHAQAMLPDVLEQKQNLAVEKLLAEKYDLGFLTLSELLS